jgi:hypothetical protein
LYKESLGNLESLESVESQNHFLFPDFLDFQDFLKDEKQMKKCPTCDKTFDDGLRFCQTDGTPLVEAAETSSEDPYKTIVADTDATAPSDPFKTIVGMPSPIDKKEEVLEFPEEPDMLKTMVSSLNKFKDKADADDVKKVPPSQFNDLTPPGGTKAENAGDAVPLPSEPPNFDAIFSQKPTASDSLPKPDETSSSVPTSSTGRSPVSETPPPQFDPKPLPSESSSSRSPLENPPSPPIPSPFDRSMPPRYQTPSVPPFMEAEIKAEALNTPYAEQVEQQNQQMQQPDWSPPASSWENKEIGQNTPFQPPAAGSGKNQTLAIVSLVCGILSMLCCVSVITGPAGLITGFMAKKNAEQNPNEYGGKSLALGGIITGAIGTALFVVLLILQIFFGVLGGIFGNI